MTLLQIFLRKNRLLGPNGAGKVLVKIALGLIEATSGNITVLEQCSDKID